MTSAWRWLAVSVVFLAAMFVPFSARAVTNGTWPSQAEALAACTSMSPPSGQNAAGSYHYAFKDCYRPDITIYYYQARYTVVETGSVGCPSPLGDVACGWYRWDIGVCTGACVPPAPTCTAGTQHEGLWPPAGGGTVSVNGCCATPYMDFDKGTTGVEETGGTCDAATNPPPVESDPPPQAVTCHDDGTCTYCDVDNTGVCFDGPPPFSVSGGGDPPPATSTPPPPPASDPGTGDGGTGDGGSGDGGTGTGTGGGGGLTGTGNPEPQPGNNGDWATSTPDASTTSECTAGDACNAGQASGVVGQLYQPGSATIGSLYGDFRAQVSQAPLLQAGKNFFTVNAAGTCPTWHIPGNKYWGEAGFDFSFFCDPAILAILAAAGWIVLAVGAFNAFRIAIY